MPPGWYGVKGTEVDQSYFKSFTGLMSGYAPTRKFAEDIHGYGEYCKYGHIRQAIAKANP